MAQQPKEKYAEDEIRRGKATALAIRPRYSTSFPGLDIFSQRLPSAASPDRHIELPVTSLVIGGAIPDLCFRSRLATRDVNYYHEDSASKNLLADLGQEVARHMHWNQPEARFNSSVGSIIDADPAFATVAQEAREGNVLLYETQALRFVIAPWHF